MREVKKASRPINLRKTAYEREQDRLFEEGKFSPYFQDKFQERFLQEKEEVEWQQQTLYNIKEGLKQWQQKAPSVRVIFQEFNYAIIERRISMIKKKKIMSEKINYIDNLTVYDRARLLEYDEELMTPIIAGLKKRKTRLAKAKIKIRHIYQRHTDEYIQERRKTLIKA